jgi:hypothetical protein
LGQGLGGDASRPFLLLAYGAANWPMVREAQRHLAQWALMPIAAMIGQEASEKLGQPVTLDVMRPLQALDAGGRARELGACAFRDHPITGSDNIRSVIPI